MGGIPTLGSLERLRRRWKWTSVTGPDSRSVRDEEVAAIFADPFLAEIALLLPHLEPMHRTLIRAGAGCGHGAPAQRVSFPGFCAGGFFTAAPAGEMAGSSVQAKRDHAGRSSSVSKAIGGATALVLGSMVLYLRLDNEIPAQQRGQLQAEKFLDRLLCTALARAGWPFAGASNGEQQRLTGTDQSTQEGVPCILPARCASMN